MDRLDCIRRFAARHALLPGGVLDAARLYRLARVEFIALSPATRGCAWFAPGRWLAQHRILVNASLDERERLAVVGHELAHRLLAHPNGLYTSLVGGDWPTRAIEREAEAGAAVLLVGRRLALELARSGLTCVELEDVFGVPSRLIELRLRLP